ncbi:hypothetical protein [Nostoc sp. ChiQUE01b]|uniref:hypothetical protein n=1 Tax=Nostoc sp. ChiQUE01b TaxID=3075376 RepID=UPI002AD267CA|nr:hypothetical protein [Nostoc sp. ChiQUE01b]MDZ8257671.1 hypothetical protein [Nostoc sp. ChiQUE01b]
MPNPQSPIPRELIRQTVTAESKRNYLDYSCCSSAAYQITKDGCSYTADSGGDTLVNHSSVTIPALLSSATHLLLKNYF